MMDRKGNIMANYRETKKYVHAGFALTGDELVLQIVAGGMLMNNLDASFVWDAETSTHVLTCRIMEPTSKTPLADLKESLLSSMTSYAKLGLDGLAYAHYGQYDMQFQAHDGEVIRIDPNPDVVRVLRECTPAYEAAVA